MANGTTEERIFDELRAIRRKLDRVGDDVHEHGQQLASLCTLTGQQEKRLDRMDRRAGGLGAGAGGLAGLFGGFLAGLFKSWGGP